MDSLVQQELDLYRKAVNKMDDRIEYSLSMPSDSRCALYEILSDLTQAIAALHAQPIPYEVTEAGKEALK